MSFSLHDAQGRIVGIISSSEQELPFYLDAYGATGWVAGSWQWERYRVVDGQAVEFPEKPSLEHRWDWVAGEWRDPRSLAELKASHWEALKAARDTAIEGGFTWDGSTFDSDPASQQRIQGAVQLALLAAQAGQPFTVDWTLYDNTTRTLTGADMVAVGLALGEHVQTHFVIGQTLRDAVNAATTREEVEAVVWDGRTG